MATRMLELKGVSKAFGATFEIDARMILWIMFMENWWRMRWAEA